MSIWFTADQHFFHTNIIRYVDRPFSNAHEMNKAIIDNFNRHVHKGDVVYFLGDFGLGPKELLKNTLSRLNGKKKILISGNHDKGRKSMLEIGFDEVHDYMDLNLDGIKLLLSHIPIYSCYHDVTVSGHVHDLFKINGSILNVGVDVWDFKPVSWATIKAMFDGGYLNKRAFCPVHVVPDGSI